MNNDPKNKQSVERATERVHEDVRTEADVEGAGQAQLEAERKQPNTSQKQAQAREAGEAKAHGEDASHSAEAANEQRQGQTGWRAQAEPHSEESHRQSQERLQPLEKSGSAGHTPDGQKAVDDGYGYTVTENRMDAMASVATPDTEEARRNEAGPTDNISAHGAYSDNPDEVDQISGPPMESISKDKVDKQ